MYFGFPKYFHDHMGNRPLFVRASLLLFSIAIPAAAQQSEPLGDVAKHLHAEKGGAAISPELPGKQDYRSETAKENPKSLSFSEPISQLQMFAWIAGGMAQEDLINEIGSHGVTFEPDEACFSALTETGNAALAKELGMAQRHADDGQLKNDEATAQIVKTAISVKKKDYQAALRQISPLLELEPANPNLLFALGNIFGKLGSFDNVVRAAVRAIQLEPDFPHAHGQLSFAYYRLGDGEQAVNEARAMLRLLPNSSDGHKLVGLGLSAQGNDAGALLEYDKALELNPKNAAAYYDIGLIRNQQHDWELAITAYQHATVLDPSVWFYFNNLGIVLGKVGRVEQALAAFEKGRAVGPDEPELLQSYGSQLCSAGRETQAIEVFTSLLQKVPEWNMARPCLYRLLMRAGHAEEEKKVK
jgi:tetratricopeptide (TPR) repeat protein